MNSDPSIAPGVTVRLKSRTPQYEEGHLLLVERVDTDGTFIGRDPVTGRTSDWIKCRDVDVVHAIGWDFLASALTPRGRKLLEAFDGHRQLALKTAIADTLVREVPDLASAVIETHDELRANAPPPRARRAPTKRPPRGRPPPPPMPLPASGRPPRRPVSSSRTEPEPELDLPALTFGAPALPRASADTASNGETAGSMGGAAHG